ncbi:MAG: hypothetical protein ACQEP1_06555 [Nanobdellota archaeon]
MDKRAAIQVSVNMLVVIIISIVVLGMGFTLVNRMMSSGEENINQVDDRLKNQIESTLREDSKPVTIPVVQKTINKDNVGTFAVGVLNLDDSDKFIVDVEYDTGYTEEGDEIIDTSPKVIPTMDLYKEVEVGNNEAETFSVPIEVPPEAESGEYIFNVYICSGSGSCDGDTPTNDLYDNNLHKLYVKVP